MTPRPTVRPATRSDRSAIRSLALDNAMFLPAEMDGFDERLDGFLDDATEQDTWLVAIGDDTSDVVGAAYCAPEPFADRVWNLYFLATHPARHGSGIGSTLLAAVEEALRGAGAESARVLLIDTSSTEQYRDTRDFYTRQGFTKEARIRDFYSPGDHKVTFWKALPPQA